MRFFFNLSDEISCLDEEGLDLPDVGQAREKAIEAARSILSDEVLRGRLPLRDVITVTDESGSPVAIVRFRDVVEIHT